MTSKKTEKVTCGMYMLGWVIAFWSWAVIGIIEVRALIPGIIGVAFQTVFSLSCKAQYYHPFLKISYVVGAIFIVMATCIMGMPYNWIIMGISAITFPMLYTMIEYTVEKKD